jgi:hypothetical protein
MNAGISRRSNLMSSVRLVPWRARGMVKHIPGLSQLQRLLVRRFLDSEAIFDAVDARAARRPRFLLTLPEDKGVWTGSYELPLARALAEPVRTGDVRHDAGAGEDSSGASWRWQGRGSSTCSSPRP